MSIWCNNLFEQERRAMSEDWDKRMSENPTYYIAARGNDSGYRWDMEEFFRVGEEQTILFTKDFFSRNGFSPDGKVMLEIGCGIGRMTRAFAETFKLVYALDISPVAIGLGQKINQQFENIRWIIGNGVDLSGLSDECFDFVFSYIVFQHIPVKEILFQYIREIGRVLKPEGLLKFQVCNDPKFPKASSLAIQSAEKEKANTFSSYYVPRDEVLDKMSISHLRCLSVTGEGTQYMWVEGRKTCT
jgi:ubiquinone/menaquinone biosynthesis C-methylase UbiE